MTSLTTNLRTWLKSRLQSTFNRLPSKAKRLIFISTLFRIIERDTVFDIELVKKLNSILQVARNNSAWELPMTFSSLIWSNLNTNVIAISIGNITLCELKSKSLNSEDELEVANWFVSRMPNWLRYGSDDLLRHDVIALITQLRKLEAA